MTIPKYREEKGENKIEEFDEPLLLFPREQVEYLSNINQMPSLPIPDQRNKICN